MSVPSIILPDSILRWFRPPGHARIVVSVPRGLGTPQDRPVFTRWSDSMRYRRLSYRYAVVMATSRPRTFGESWQRQPASIGLGHSFWRPPADVVETANEVIVLVELAGVDHEQLDVL